MLRVALFHCLLALLAACDPSSPTVAVHREPIGPTECDDLGDPLGSCCSVPLEIPLSYVPDGIFLLQTVYPSPFGDDYGVVVDVFKHPVIDPTEYGAPSKILFQGESLCGWHRCVLPPSPEQCPCSISRVR